MIASGSIVGKFYLFGGGAKQLKYVHKNINQVQPIYSKNLI